MLISHRALGVLQNIGAGLLLASIVSIAVFGALDAWRAWNRPASPRPLTYEEMSREDRTLVDQCAAAVAQTGANQWTSPPCSDLRPGSAVQVYRRLDDLVAQQMLSR